MQPGELRDILHDLDGFVESELGFDELTEFFVQVAETSRDRDDVSVSAAIRLVMDAFRQNGESSAKDDPIEGAMPRF